MSALRVIRARLTACYVQLPNFIAQAPASVLSTDAIALAANILSRSEGWTTNAERLQEHHDISLKRLRAAFQQLARVGYARLVAVRCVEGIEAGRFRGQYWEITPIAGHFAELPPGHCVIKRYFTDRPDSDRSVAGTVGTPTGPATDRSVCGRTIKNKKTESKKTDSEKNCGFPPDGRIRYGFWETIARAALPHPIPPLEDVGRAFVAARLSKGRPLNGPDVSRHFENFCRQWRMT